MEEAARAWIAAETGARLVVVGRSLSFGTTSELTAVDADGRPLVLRRWDRADPLDEAPARARSELRALEAGRAVLGDLVPEPIGADPSGDQVGCPAVLMSRVPGTPVVHDLDVVRLVEPAARLHRAEPPDDLPAAQHWFDPRRLAVPSWTTSPSTWEALQAIVREAEPAGPAGFLHRDYHPGNVLWSSGAITGIVDWADASVGPAGIDVAHTRTNLALVDGPDAAARYLDAYRALRPSYRHDTWWDAADLIGFDEEHFAGVLAFNAFGAHLDLATVRRRADAYAATIIRTR